MKGYKIKFRVMGLKGGNWMLLASYDSYEQAEEKVNSVGDGFKMLEIRKVWIQ